jgi:hypothetical protein
MGNIKTIAISVVGGFVAGYATKWAVDYFAAKKAAATEEAPNKEDEAAE